MSDLTYGNYGAATQDRTRTLFGQTMGYVAITAVFPPSAPTWGGTCPKAGPSYGSSSPSAA